MAASSSQLAAVAMVTLQVTALTSDLGLSDS